MNIGTPLTAVKGLTDSSLVDLVDEVIRRIQAGEAIDPEALAGDDPQRAKQIRQLLPTLEKLADLGGSATIRRNRARWRTRSSCRAAVSPRTDRSSSSCVSGGAGDIFTVSPWN